MTSRQEIKYLINYREYFLIKNFLYNFLRKDHFSLDKPYKVKSLYFDNFQANSFYEKISGEYFRFKLRARYYNENYNSIKIELKKKENMSTKKSAYNIRMEDLNEIINSQNLNYKNISKINHNIKNYILLYKLKPQMLISYNREAYIDKFSDTRITFDTDLKSSYQTRKFFDNNIDHYVPLLTNNEVVLELKFKKELPIHIKSFFEKFNLNRMALSKYVIGYKYFNSGMSENVTYCSF